MDAFSPSIPPPPLVHQPGCWGQKALQRPNPGHQFIFTAFQMDESQIDLQSAAMLIWNKCTFASPAGVQGALHHLYSIVSVHLTMILQSMPRHQALANGFHLQPTSANPAGCTTPPYIGCAAAAP